VHLPFALERKYPNANREWIWQFVFPSTQIAITEAEPVGVSRLQRLSLSLPSEQVEQVPEPFQPAQEQRQSGTRFIPHLSLSLKQILRRLHSSSFQF
jgi:hypothetical protein